MSDTAIIKLGALGDVLRTTTILRRIKGNITWVTRQECFPLLKNNPLISRVVSIGEAVKMVSSSRFDIVLGLDDEYEACSLVSSMRAKKVIGAYLDSNQGLRYTEDAAGWFDMGLISRFGRAHTNELKRANHRSYQEHLFTMLGLRFVGEEYVLAGERVCGLGEVRVGIEGRTGPRWPMKRWPGYTRLYERARAMGAEVSLLGERASLEEYIQDIGRTDVIVCGDTLCMHIGLALRKRVIALFGPTSADEIFDYGRLRKVVSPAPCIKCYKRECGLVPNCMELIEGDIVLDVLREEIGAIEAERLKVARILDGAY